MITLIGALLGFLTAIVPQFFEFFKARQDNLHELAMLDKQVQIAQIEGQSKMQAAQLDADIAEMNSLSSRVTLVGIKWVDALSATVRPVITYAFFIAYATVKFCQIYAMMQGTLPWHQDIAGALVGAWGDEDQALFAAVMTFWFGSRTFEKQMKLR